jgi:K+-dependent Na+/Ca+ exchanger-like protein
MTLVLALGGLLLGLALLEVGADHVTEAVAAIARRFDAPQHVVGLLTAGGEWEELVVVGLALAGGHPGLAIGNVIGSCLANLIGSLPLGLFGSRPVIPDRSARAYALVLLLVTVLAAGFLADGGVNRLEGGVLVGLFVVYAGSIVVVINRGWLRPLTEDDDDDDDDEATASGGAGLLKLGLISVAALVALAVGAELVVWGAVIMAEWFGLSEYAIGATIVAVGTTLPDKAISWIGGRRGHGGLVTANAVGSNIFILTLILGLAALGSTTALTVAPTMLRVDLPLLVLATVVVALLFRRPALHRGTGGALLAVYAAYLAFALIRGG